VRIEAKGFRIVALDKVEVLVARETALGSLKLELAAVG